MNKELIKEYKSEFDYLLNGGNLVVLMENSISGYDNIYWNYDDDDSSRWFNLVQPEHVFTILINDAYFPYRKALAEGKIVEYLVPNQPWQVLQPPVTSGGWIWDSVPISNYRIKPDAPKFKAGDWVRFTDTPTQIEQYNGKPYHSKVNIELWKPQPGEWVIPYNELYKDSFVVELYNEEEHLLNCEPFIGNLPHSLQH